MKKNLPQIIAATISASLMAVGIVWAWTEPGQAPPSGNTPAPINVSSTAQTKAGNLTVNEIYAGNFRAAPGYATMRLMGNAGSARTEVWDRLSVSGVDSFGNFYDPGSGGIAARGPILAGVGGAYGQTYLQQFGMSSTGTIYIEPAENNYLYIVPGSWTENLDTIMYGSLQVTRPGGFSSGGTYLGLFAQTGRLTGYPGYAYPVIKTDSPYLYFDVGGTYSSWVSQGGIYAYNNGNGILYAYGAVYGPIFYDVNNTGYYLDPNNYSVVENLKVNGYLYGNSANVVNVPSPGTVAADDYYIRSISKWASQLGGGGGGGIFGGIFATNDGACVSFNKLANNTCSCPSYAPNPQDVLIELNHHFFWCSN